MYPITFRETTDYQPDPDRPGVSMIRRASDNGALRVGDAYFAHPSNVARRADGVMCVHAVAVSRHFREDRRPIMLVLPDGYHLPIDSAWWGDGRNEQGQRDGWQVTLGSEPRDGESLLLSLAPSVNIVGSYHGWVGTSGVPPGWIGDDLEGRASQHAARWAPRRRPATDADRLRLLDALLAKLPTTQCVEGCADCCGPIAMTRIEWDRIQAARPTGAAPLAITCPLLNSITQKCKVYAIRPAICRLFGVARGMECPHRIVPPPLTREQAFAVLRAVERISDDPSLMVDDPAAPAPAEKET